MSTKKLAVIIPVYNQTTLCRQCFGSLKNQTFRDFQVIMVDDGGSQDYQSLITEFPELEIRYKRNDKNLGAIRNIFHTIFYPVDTEYVMSMHEDDLLHPRYLEAAVSALDTHSKAAFCGSNCIFFDRQEDAQNLSEQKGVDIGAKELSSVDFVRFMLQDNPFMLASVVYRRSALAASRGPNLEGLSIACDRPFLVDLVQGNRTCLALNQPFFYSRRHGKKDMRGRDLNWRQAFGLFEYYRNHLPQPLIRSDKKIFLASSTNNLLLTYRSLFPDKRPGLLRYIKEGKGLGLIDLKYLDRKGVFGLIAMAVGSRLSFYLILLRQKFK